MNNDNTLPTNQGPTAATDLPPMPAPTPVEPAVTPLPPVETTPVAPPPPVDFSPAPTVTVPTPTPFPSSVTTTTTTTTEPLTEVPAGLPPLEVKTETPTPSAETAPTTTTTTTTIESPAMAGGLPPIEVKTETVAPAEKKPKKKANKRLVVGGIVAAVFVAIVGVLAFQFQSFTGEQRSKAREAEPCKVCSGTGSSARCVSSGAKSCSNVLNECTSDANCRPKPTATATPKATATPAPTAAPTDERERDTPTPTPRRTVGQSCTGTAACANNLACVNGICVGGCGSENAIPCSNGCNQGLSPLNGRCYTTSKTCNPIQSSAECAGVTNGSRGNCPTGQVCVIQGQTTGSDGICSCVSNTAPACTSPNTCVPSGNCSTNLKRPTYSCAGTDKECCAPATSSSLPACSTLGSNLDCGFSTGSNSNYIPSGSTACLSGEKTVYCCPAGKYRDPRYIDRVGNVCISQPSAGGSTSPTCASIYGSGYSCVNLTEGACSAGGGSYRSCSPGSGYPDGTCCKLTTSLPACSPAPEYICAPSGNCDLPGQSQYDDGYRTLRGTDARYCAGADKECCSKTGTGTPPIGGGGPTGTPSPTPTTPPGGETPPPGGTPPPGTAAACVNTRIFINGATSAATAEQLGQIKIGDTIRMMVVGNSASLVGARFDVKIGGTLAGSFPVTTNVTPIRADGVREFYYDYKISQAGSYAVEGYVNTVPPTVTATPQP